MKKQAKLLVHLVTLSLTLSSGILASCQDNRTYTITWKNYDGSVLEVDENVARGTVPTYDGLEPEKVGDDNFAYTFVGWTPVVVAAKKNTEYIATFQEVQKYKITWRNYNGDTLKVDYVPKGTIPEYKGETPVQQGSEQYSYVFAGWSPTPKEVDGEKAYVATFTREINKYTITWKDYNGKVLEKDENVPYGTVPTYDGQNPSRSSVRGASFTWKGWSPEIKEVTSDQEYIAAYEQENDYDFSIFPYELEPGYTLNDLQGAPWINSNLEGEIHKIKKPSLKDDYYVSVNYELLKGNFDGAFGICDGRVANATNAIYSGENETTNGQFFKAVLDKISDGDVINIKNSLSNINVNNYLTSKDCFASNSSMFVLLPNETGYEVAYNDGLYYGYYTGNSGIHTIEFLTIFDNYKYMVDPLNNILNHLNEMLDLNLSESTINDCHQYEQNLSYRVYYDNYSASSGTNTYTVNTVPWANMKSALLDLGLKSSDKITIRKRYNNAINQFYNTVVASHSDVAEAMIKMRLAFDDRFFLGADNYRTLNSDIRSLGIFRSEAYLSGMPTWQLARQLTSLAYRIIYEQCYIQQEGSPETKNRVAEIIDEVLDGYMLLMQDNEWISKNSKDNITKKLNYMKYASCYSDHYRTFPKIDDTDLNNTSLNELNNRYLQAYLEAAIDKNIETNDYWGENGMPSYTVNAFYSSTSNSFVILNGLSVGLLGETVEETYGLLGAVIGHEISHAFDSSGSYYDEYGNNNDILASRDRAKFNDKVNKMVSFYNNIVQYDNVTANGEHINGEATADMGGVRVMLKLAEKIDNFNYDEFFRSYAYVWCRKATSYEAMPKRVEDEHPLNYLRTNVTLAQFDEFQKTYDIQPGDGMYVAPEDRIAIW